MNKQMMIRNLLAGGLLWAALTAGTGAKDTDFFLHDGDAVVFLGDSITEQKLYTTYLEAYALTRFPKWKFSFRNVGWGGDTAWLRQRAHPDENALFAAKGEDQQKMVELAVGTGLERDVLPLKPTVVTVDFGMNDHAYTAFREDIFSAYARSQTEIVKVLAKHGARVALLTPQPIEERRADPDQDVRNQSLRKFSDGLKEIGAKNQALFVEQFDPYMAIMLKARATNPQAAIGGGDAVHPGPAGHTLMAWAILKGLSAPALVSLAEVNVTDAKQPKVTAAEKCLLTNLKFDQGTLGFDRLDDALPMPVDARAEPALKLAPVLDDLSRYDLKVTGLAPGDYELTVDGEAAATVTAEDLAKGYNLTACAGPITKQAQAVLALVFKKNDVYFERWRNVQLNGGTAERLQELDKQLGGLETEINAARIPKIHHYELKLVAKYYLMTSFGEPGGNGLRLALSTDGYRWSALNQDRIVLTPEVGAAKCLRDPSIGLDAQGTFHIVWTLAWGAQPDKGIGYVCSKDLIHFEPQKMIPVMENEPETTLVWAPELFWDEVQQQWMIFWASTVKGKFPETLQVVDGNLNSRIYYTTTKDFEHFQPSKLLFGPREMMAIDPCILHPAPEKYIMFVKGDRAEAPKSGFFAATATRAEGPYTLDPRIISAPNHGGDEGPTAMKIKDEYLLYFGCVSAGNICGAYRSKDLSRWEDCTAQMVPLPGYRHGTVIEIPGTVARTLIGHYGYGTQPHP